MAARKIGDKLPPPDDPLRFDVKGLVYLFDREPQPSGGKVAIRVAQGGFVKVRDRADLYAMRSRLAFADVVADLCGLERKDVAGHFALILDEIERRQVPESDEVKLTKERRRAALELLQAPDLFERAIDAVGALGYVGEERNKGLVYLVGTGRLLKKPPSALVMASSGSGKSELLNACSRLFPDEDVRSLTRITTVALHYADADYLRHKLVVVDEQQGSADADHAIRVLQSQGYLSQATAAGGTLRNHLVQGPIALLSGTTSPRLNPENLSRCLELTLDDSPEQTRRIHEAQRRAWAGLNGSSFDPTVFQDAQRLLEPLDVVIPFAQQLDFPARTTHDRRGNVKLLSLVAAHALLYQHQRERSPAGQVVAEPEDYAAVYSLVKPDLELRLDGLSQRTGRALRLLAGSDTPLSRREVAASLGWAYNTAKAALGELVEQELVLQVAFDRPAKFRLLDASPLGGNVQLVSPEALSP